MEAANALRDFLFEAVYAPINAQPTTRHAEHVVTALYEHYVQQPTDVPSDDAPALAGESLERRVVDVVCGMTDRYAMRAYERLFMPRAEEM